MSTETAKQIRIHTVSVAKKGKGVKGVYQVIKAFGEPVREKGAKKDAPVSEFDYDWVDDYSLKQIDDAIEAQSGVSMRLIKESRVRGIDYVLRHESVQANAEVSTIVSYILENDLAETKELAKEVSVLWQKNMASDRANMLPVKSLEYYAKYRKVWVDGEKKKGTWKTTLVKTTEEAKPEGEAKPEVTTDTTTDTPAVTQ